MRNVRDRFWALSFGLLLVACWPLAAGDRGQSPNGDKPKPDKPEKPAAAAVGPRYEGLVKSISAEAVTLGSVSAKAARPLGGDGEGEREVTLGLSGETRYAQLLGSRREDLTTGRLVALALSNTEAGIVARGVVVYTGAAADGQAICDAAAGLLVAITSGMGSSAEGRSAMLRPLGDQPGRPAKEQAPRTKGMVGSIESISGDQLVVSMGGAKLAVSITGAALGKAEPRNHDQVLVGSRVVAQCAPKAGEGGGRSALALVMMPAG